MNMKNLTKKGLHLLVAAILSIFSLLHSQRASAQCTAPSPTLGTVDATWFTINWSTVSGALWYSIQYRELPSGAWTSLSATPPTTTITITGLMPNTDYEYRMRSNCSGPTQSSWATITPITTLASSSCGTPSLTAGTKTISSLNFTWAAISGASYYRVRHRAVGAGSWNPVVTTSGTSFTISGLSAGTDYEMEVQTVCSLPFNISSWSTTLSMKTCENVSVLASPTSVCSTKSSSISATSANDPNYTYTWMPGSLSGASQTVSPASTTVYTVTATEAGSCTVTKTLTVTVTPWSKNNSVGSNSQSETIADGTSVLFIDNTCNALAQVIDVSGGNVLGSTTVTDVVAATEDQTTLPGRMFGRRKITIAPTSNGPAYIKLYFSQADFDSYNSTNASLSNYYLSLPTSGNNSDPNKIYFRIIKIVGGVPNGYLRPISWNSAISMWEALDTLTTLDATYGFYTMPSCNGITVSGLATGTIGSNSAVITWTAVTPPPTGFYGIRYENVTDNPGVWSYLSSGSGTTSATITGLTPGKNYNVQIRRECSSQSWGAWSTSVNFNTTATCLTPSGITATPNSTTTATISWSAVSGASWYNVRYREQSGPGAWTTLSASGTSSSLSGLTASTTYDYQVLTKCSVNDISAWSTIDDFTTPAMRAGNEVLADATSSSIVVYPNPISNQVTIDGLNLEKGATVTITDISGKRLYTNTMSKSEDTALTIPTEHFAKGVYILNIESASGKHTIKLSK